MYLVKISQQLITSIHLYMKMLLDKFGSYNISYHLIIHLMYEFQLNYLFAFPNTQSGKYITHRDAPV